MKMGMHGEVLRYVHGFDIL